MTTAAADPPNMLAVATRDAEAQLGAARPYQAGRNVGLVPTTIEQATTLAQVLCKADMMPKQYREKPADVLVAILFGSDLGLAPMQAVQSIATINGRPSIYGDGFLAVIYTHPAFKEHDEYFLVNGARVDAESLTAAHLTVDETAAVCKFERHGRRTATVRKFSIADAKKAHLWTKDGPWKEYPSRMLMYRARGFAGRDAFPDALRGLTLAEEARDLPVIDTEALEPSVAMPQRQTEVAAAAAVVVEPAVTAAAPTPATPAALPEGCDRIVELLPQPFADRPTLWTAKTETGALVFGYQPKVDLPALHASQAVARLTIGPRTWKDMREVVAVEVRG